MMQIGVDQTLYLLIAYLLGALPMGLFIGKGFYNTDIRQYGSKNLGATNAYRVLGLKAALIVFALDAAKGAIGVYLLSPDSSLMVLGGLCAMIGHNWPIYLRFKGGRGVATGLGVLLALSPVSGIVAFSVWALIVKATKYVSLGSIIAAILVPFVMYFLGEDMPKIVFGAVAAAFVVLRHRENIKRLLTGKELEVKRINKE